MLEHCVSEQDHAAGQGRAALALCHAVTVNKNSGNILSHGGKRGLREHTTCTQPDVPVTPCWDADMRANQTRVK